MDVLAGIPLALLGHGLDHGHEVVAGLRLDLLDPVDADDFQRRRAGDLVGRRLRDGAERGVRPGEGGLDEHLVAYAAVLAEDILHVLATVPVVQGTDVAHLNRAGD